MVHDDEVKRSKEKFGHKRARQSTEAAITYCRSVVSGLMQLLAVIRKVGVIIFYKTYVGMVIEAIFVWLHHSGSDEKMFLHCEVNLLLFPSGACYHWRRCVLY